MRSVFLILATGYAVATPIPITITSGTGLQVAKMPYAVIAHMFGDAFQFGGGQLEGFNSAEVCWALSNGCFPGQEWNPGSGMTWQAPMYGGATGTYQGGNMILYGSVMFYCPLVTFAEGQLDYSYTFTMSGKLFEYYQPGKCIGGCKEFALSGAGTATAHFHWALSSPLLHPEGFRLDTVDYTFTGTEPVPAPEVTANPEPASSLMLLAGLGALALRARRSL